MKYRVRHTTCYQYSSAVTLCYNLAHLMPRNTGTQNCFSRHIQVSPRPVYQTERKDYFGNETVFFSIQEPHKALTIDVVSYLEVVPNQWPEWVANHPLTYSQLKSLLVNPQSEEMRLVKQYCLDSAYIRATPEIKAYAQSVFGDDMPVLQSVNALNHKIFTEFTFDPAATDVTTAPETTLVEKRGVCQDFAQFAIACLRSMGLAARYVSGYIETLPPPGQEKLVGSDASHAWFAVYIPELGWVEFDPTNDQIAGEQHIVTGWGRDYTDITPLQGVVFDGGDSHALNVSVDVARI